MRRRAACPASRAALRALFPTIGELHPVVLGQPLALAHVLENAALALQAQAGCPVTFGHTARTLEAGVYQVVVQYSEEAVGRRAVELAARADRGRAAGDGRFDAARRHRRNCANSTKSSAWGRAPAPSSMRPWRAAFPTGA